MVMEAATLSGPQRKFNVVPVQKSLSLPSYARAGGEGIDHRLIFAALEQKEKVRRKSKIFTREKTARQNIFCLPISTGSKCRETSLSSDTSCSSLEYQKPKPVSKSKKEENSKPTTKSIENNDLFTCIESKTTKQNLECTPKENASPIVINGSSEQNSLPIKSGHRSPVDTFRLNVGSSDSMDRSSRSSNDSLTRKERLVAIKARVEAEREKYRSSSSEEESRSSIMRYNSDGLIHRTVREVKSRSYRNEKRLRRRSQGEWAIKKLERKNNLSLCLNPDDGGIKLHLEKLDRLNSEINNLEIKTDYCPSPSFPDVAKKSYFSDFPNKENAAKFVQKRIRHIEEEERKRRSGSDFFEKLKSPLLSCKAFQDKLTSASTEHIHCRENRSAPSNYTSDLRSPSTDSIKRASPIPKSPQPPTPPPRSPKSITFVNKVFLQHQNSTLLKQENSLDRKNYFQPNIPAASQTKAFDKLNLRTESRDSLLQLQSGAVEKQQIREILSSRRKTCGNFDFVDEKLLADLSSSLENVGSNFTKSPLLKKQVNDVDDKNGESSLFRLSVNKSKLEVNKWEEGERRRDYMFNSLENRKRLPLLRNQSPLENTDNCLCLFKSGSKNICQCNSFGNSCDSKNLKSDTTPNTNIGQTFSSKPYLISNEQYLKNLKTPSSVISQDCSSSQSGSQCKSAKIEDTPFQCFAFKSNFNNVLKEKRENKAEFPYRNATEIEKDNMLFKQISSFQNNFDEKKDSYDFNSSKDKVKCSSSSVSATANLDSAMAELESVYMSLKFSSDNLSDKNSLSALSEEDSKAFYISKNNIFNDKKEHVQKAPADESSRKLVDALKISDIFEDSNIFSDPLSSSNVESNKNVHQSIKSSSFYKDLSINELFKDLTPELNALESKINLSIDKPSSVDNRQKSNFNNKPNISSSIGFKKEFYENLNKQQDAYQKKKLKAKRSLSENIAKLMTSSANDNLNSLSKNPSASCFQSSLLTSEVNSACSESSLEHGKVTPKQKLSSSLFRPVSRTIDSVDVLEPTLDEIRHIRVSMDSAAPLSVSTPPNADYNQFPRLSSAVLSPQVSPKCEATKPFQFASRSSSKENIDRTIDGLEELLNSLLVEVPEGKQSSPATKDAVASKPPSPTSTGEMRVLQHLDVIRLKPVVS